MKTRQDYFAFFLTLVGFGVFKFIQETQFMAIKECLDGFTKEGLASYILTYAIIGLPIFICTYLVSRQTKILSELGLNKSVAKGIAVALAFALPMLMGGILINGFSEVLEWREVVAATLIAGLVEEVYYRGFLFGMLYKFTRLGFLSSILLGALLFAMAHMYQSQETIQLLGIFGITFMGAGLFAWLYVEWDFNLWVPIFLHTFMNLAWIISDMGDTALGGVVPNVLRAATIALAIVGTIFYKKKKGLGLSIIRDKLIAK